MVSTRQMATSSGSVVNTNNLNIIGNNNNNIDELARLSVVTRQSSSNNILVNCSNIESTPNEGNNIQATCDSTITSRHQSLPQALTIGDNKGDNATSSSLIVNLLDLPIEILSHIFSFLEFKKIGQLRVISKKMNEVSMHMLNSTFTKLIAKTYNRFHAIKALMPRRESARRNHPLACECDIIETCYMRLSLLQMTFGKHIERGHCCFFPGAILDEVYTIFNYIRSTPRLERPYRVTDELFDLSTMAMEYFRDRIEPTLPGIVNIFKDYFQVPTNTKRPALVVSSDLSDSSNSLPSPPQSNMVLRKGIRKIKQGMKIYNNQLSVLRNELSTCKRKSTEQGKQIAEQQKLLAEQQKQTLEYANRLDENDRKNEEMSRKFSTLLQELNKCKTELQYWRSKSPAIPICTSCGQKMGPVLPPEDYQALINQGVKPEDILNLNDDTDAGSDTSICENNSILKNEFIFPDETTTAKLLAVNTATKNLKRLHSDTTTTITASTTVTTANQIATTSNMNMYTSNENGTINIPTINTRENSDNNNKKDIFMTTTTSAKFLNTILSSGGNEKVTDINEKYLKCSNDIANDGSTPTTLNTSYPTKLFYGSQQQRSVIVTPNCSSHNVSAASTSAAAAASIAKTNIDPADNVNNSHSTTIVGNKAEALSNVNTNVSTALYGSASDMCSNHSIDATSLQSIAAHETKKARRVQKTTRCLSTNSGKRSK